MRKTLARWARSLRGTLRAGAGELSARTLQFYGGCALIAFGDERLPIVGAILVVHATLGPLLTRWGAEP